MSEQYRFKSTGSSSHRLGPCEVCGEHVSEVYLRVAERFEDGRRVYLGPYRFGHESCLATEIEA